MDYYRTGQDSLMTVELGSSAADPSGRFSWTGAIPTVHSFMGNLSPGQGLGGAHVVRWIDHIVLVDIARAFTAMAAGYFNSTDIASSPRYRDPSTGYFWGKYTVNLEFPVLPAYLKGFAGYSGSEGDAISEIRCVVEPWIVPSSQATSVSPVPLGRGPSVVDPEVYGFGQTGGPAGTMSKWLADTLAVFRRARTGLGSEGDAVKYHNVSSAAALYDQAPGMPARYWNPFSNMGGSFGVSSYYRYFTAYPGSYSAEELVSRTDQYPYRYRYSSSLVPGFSYSRRVEGDRCTLVAAPRIDYLYSILAGEFARSATAFDVMKEACSEPDLRMGEAVLDWLGPSGDSYAALRFVPRPSASGFSSSGLGIYLWTSQGTRVDEERSRIGHSTYDVTQSYEVTTTYKVTERLLPSVTGSQFPNDDPGSGFTFLERRFKVAQDGQSIQVDSSQDGFGGSESDTDYDLIASSLPTRPIVRLMGAVLDPSAALPSVATACSRYRLDLENRPLFKDPEGGYVCDASQMSARRLNSYYEALRYLSKCALVCRATAPSTYYLAPRDVGFTGDGSEGDGFESDIYDLSQRVQRFWQRDINTPFINSPPDDGGDHDLSGDDPEPVDTGWVQSPSGGYVSSYASKASMSSGWGGVGGASPESPYLGDTTKVCATECRSAVGASIGSHYRYGRFNAWGYSISSVTSGGVCVASFLEQLQTSASDGRSVSIRASSVQNYRTKYMVGYDHNVGFRRSVYIARDIGRVRLFGNPGSGDVPLSGGTPESPLRLVWTLDVGYPGRTKDSCTFSPPVVRTLWTVETLESDYLQSETSKTVHRYQTRLAGSNEWSGWSEGIPSGQRDGFINVYGLAQLDDAQVQGMESAVDPTVDGESTHRRSVTVYTVLVPTDLYELKHEHWGADRRGGSVEIPPVLAVRSRHTVHQIVQALLARHGLSSSMSTVSLASDAQMSSPDDGYASPMFGLQFPAVSVDTPSGGGENFKEAGVSKAVNVYYGANLMGYSDKAYVQYGSVSGRRYSSVPTKFPGDGSGCVPKVTYDSDSGFSLQSPVLRAVWCPSLSSVDAGGYRALAVIPEFTMACNGVLDPA